MQEFMKHIHPEDRDRIKQVGLQLRRGEKIFMDEEFRINTGDSVKWMRYIAIVRKYSGDNDLQIIGLNQDITHIKKQEERNQKILEALPDFIFIFDTNFFICDLLKSAEIQLLHSLEELVGADGRTIFSEDVSALYIESINQCLRSGKLIEIEYYLDARGSRHYFQARMVPFENNKVLALIHDISDRVKYMQELIDAKQKAETADKLKSAFLANMSHEIRTPLNAIIGFSDLLMTAVEPEEKEEYIQIINANNDLLLKLINDILDLSRIESGSMELKYEEFDLAEYFNEIASSMQQRMNNPNVRLLSVNPYTCCIVKLDKSRFAQILTNYVTNAIKYTSKGFIEMGYGEVDGGIRLYVKDTGIGIADDKKAKVFSRFEKLDEFAQGTGLGLSICKAIADVCGGGVGFESEYGQGSVFWAILPCSVSVTGDKGEKDNKQESVIEDWTEREVLTDVKSMNRKLILVAEDIQSNYLLISASLQKDYDLIRAVNGKEAVEIVRTVPGIDLVLMDMKMPETDGMTATREIRTFNKKLPIIALTAYAFDTDKQAALAAGCNDYLVKPIDKVKLRAVLQKYG
ncbi:MAG TPA: hybrid sensor histidine kinase/response regulator [Culturomica sp.]|nr:hybrid sensor histidine kinase/response regulator [Culturomica sp.]